MVTTGFLEYHATVQSIDPKSERLIVNDLNCLNVLNDLNNSSISVVWFRRHKDERHKPLLAIIGHPMILPGGR